MTLYRAVRFYGSGALTFDGITWEGAGAANQSHNGYTGTLTETWAPAVSGDKATFLNNIGYKDDISWSMTSVPAGDYEVFVYMVNNGYPNTYGLTINGTAFKPNLTLPGNTGVPRWERHGPFPVHLASTGTITVATTGGNYMNIPGVAIYQATRGGSGTVKVKNDWRETITATSTTWVDVATIPAADLEASHKYLIIGSAFASMNSNTANLRFRLVHGTTPTVFDDADADSELENGIQHTNFSWMTVYTQPGTAEQIKIQMSCSTSTGTLDHAELTTIDLTDLVENTDYWFTEDLADYNTTTTPTSKASVTFTANGSDTYLYLAEMQTLPVSTTSNYLADLYDSVAGTLAQLDIEGEEVGQEKRRHVMMSAVVPSAASHTVSIRLSHETSIHSIKSTRVFVLRLNVFEDFAITRSASSAQPAAYTSYSDVSLSVNPTTTGLGMVLGYFENDVNNQSDVLYSKIQMQSGADNILDDRPNYAPNAAPIVPGRDGWDPTDIVPNLWATVAPFDSGTSQAIDLKVSLQTGTSLRVQNRTLVYFSEKLATGGGGQTALPSLIGSGEALYSPTLTPGNATVSPALLGAPVVYTPVVQPGYGQITAPMIATGETLYGHTITAAEPGAQVVTAPLIGSGEVMYSPIVAGPLLVPLITTGEVMYAPLVSSGVVISIDALFGAPVVYTPTATPGNASVAPPRIGTGEALYIAQVLAGMVVIQTPQIGTGEAVYTPTGTFDLNVTITVNSLIGGPTVFVPESSGGTKIVKPGNPGLFRIGLDIDGDRWVDWEGRYDINLIPAAVWYDYLPHGEINATVTDRQEKTPYGLIVRNLTGADTTLQSYTRLGTNITPAASVSPSTDYTIIVWAKSNLQNPAAALTLYDQDGTYLATSPEKVIGSYWTKFRYVYTTPSSGVTGLQVAFDRSYGNQVTWDVDLTGWGIYQGVTTNDFNSGALPGQPFPSLITEDITRYVVDVSWDSGTKGDPAQLTPMDGEITIKLNNVSQDWTPRNALSPYYEKLHEHTIIEVQVDEYGTGNWRQLWTGFFTDIEITTGKSGNRQAVITGRQGLEELSYQPVLYQPKTNKTATQILLDVMTEAEVPADRYSWILGVSLLGINTQFPQRSAITNFDDSTYSYPVAGVGLTPDASVRSFFDELVRNEGGFAFYDRLGRPSFRTRDAFVPGIYDEDE